MAERVKGAKISEKASGKGCVGGDLNYGSGSPTGEEGKGHSNKKKIFCGKMGGIRTAWVDDIVEMGLGEG